MAANEFLTLPLRATGAPLPPPGDPAEPGPFSLAEPDRIGALLGSAGFGHVEITGVRAPMWIGHDVADAVNYILSTPMAQALLASLGPVPASGAGRALTEALAVYRGEDGVELGCAAWLVTAVR